MKYTPKFNSNQIICGLGNVVIVTGWTPKEKVLKQIEQAEFDDSYYAAIGQLYSPTQGISYLVRNLLLNPQVRGMVLLSFTREDDTTKSCQCFYDFLLYGVTEGLNTLGKKTWIINSPVVGFIDWEIPISALNSLRKRIIYSLIFYRNVDNSVNTEAIINRLHDAKEIILRELALSPNNEPQDFPLPPVPNSPILPSNQLVHRIEGKTLAEAWVKIIHRVRTNGLIRPTTHGKWQELINLVAVITEEDVEATKPDYFPVTKEQMSDYAASHFVNQQVEQSAAYSYGDRMRSYFGVDQIDLLIDKLNTDINSSRAVISLWDSVNDNSSPNPPCLNHIWVRVFNKKLILIATFRSNDMFGAWCSNAGALRFLQKGICERLQWLGHSDLLMGELIINSQSAHVYEASFAEADKLIADQYAKMIHKEQTEYADPCGNFTIEGFVDDRLLVTQSLPGSGEVVRQYSAKNKLELLRKICAENPAIQPYHAAYLGIEIERCLNANLNGKKYTQDR